MKVFRDHFCANEPNLKIPSVYCSLAQGGSVGMSFIVLRSKLQK